VDHRRSAADYIERLLRGIFGLELAITSVVGKRKLSQNQPAVNFAGVVAGLEAGGPGDQALAARMRAVR
jgi:transcriptional regulator